VATIRWWQREQNLPPDTLQVSMVDGRATTLLHASKESSTTIVKLPELYAEYALRNWDNLFMYSA
jgi:hypothetical protein